MAPATKTSTKRAAPTEAAVVGDGGNLSSPQSKRLRSVRESSPVKKKLFAVVEASPVKATGGARAASAVTVSPSVGKKAQAKTSNATRTVSTKLFETSSSDESSSSSSSSALSSSWVPKYIHKAMAYGRRGEETWKSLTSGQQKAYTLVENNYSIPSDFETQRKYGPISGVTYYARVLSAYQVGGLLEGKDESVGVAICITCGGEGHLSRRCRLGL